MTIPPPLVLWKITECQVLKKVYSFFLNPGVSLQVNHNPKTSLQETNFVLLASPNLNLHSFV